ncbi:uncharacterized protein KZ484_007489 [Pholidichthys leucotaenia]
MFVVGEGAFSIHAPSLRDNLPEDLRSSGSADIFKRLPPGVLKVKVGEGHYQERSSSLDQEDSGIKEEEEEGEISRFTFSPVLVKNEEDEEKPQSSQLHHSRVKEENRDSLERNKPDSDPHLLADEETPESSETDISDGDWGESSELQSTLNSGKFNTVSTTDQRCTSGKKPYNCTECGKTFKHKSWLIVHERVHTGEKPHTCSECSQSFSQKGSLTEHKRTHTGEKPYRCSECGRSFAQKANLKNHIRTHTQEKPLSCPKCGKIFSKYCNLKAHLKIHFGEKRDKDSASSKSLGFHAYAQELLLSEQMEVQEQQAPNIKELEKSPSPEGFNVTITLPSPVLVNREHTEEEAHSSQLHHFQCEESRDVEGAFELESDSPEDKTPPKPEDGSVPVSILGFNFKNLLCCPECGKLFAYKAQLKSHMRSHTGERPFTCPVCQKSFAWRASFQQHKKRHTEKKPFGCSVCGKVLDDCHQRGAAEGLQKMIVGDAQKEESFTMEEDDLQSKREHGEGDMSCTFNPVKSKDDAENLQSLQLHHLQTEEIRDCVGGEDCGGPEADPNPHLLPDIKTSHSSETNVSNGNSNTGKKFICSECGRRFCRRDDLKRHMESHTREKPYSCSVCNKSVSRKQHLERHMRVHTGEKPYCCKFCHKKIADGSSLKKHQRLCPLNDSDHSQTEEIGEPGGPGADSGLHLQPDNKTSNSSEVNASDGKKFICSECGRIFSRRVNFNLHMKSHTRKKPYSCPMCSKPLNRKEHLERHMRVHTGEKPYSCSFCHKKVADGGSLKKHERLCPLKDGDQDEPFRCPFCGKRCGCHTQLKEHIMIHTGERPYSCSMCGKTFNRKGTLSMHLKIHTEKPFSCSSCQKNVTRNHHIENT